MSQSTENRSLALPALTKRVFLLDDLPAEHDSFGAHQNIADAILRLVTTERGGRAIMLTGDWGSGKSTVVNLLQKLAKQTAQSDPMNSPEIFSFDAWAHEGDPLRRSFLERLTNALISRDWIDKERWTKKLTELERRKKLIETTSSPVLEGPALLLLALLYLVPSALALISSSHSFYYKRTTLSIGFIIYALPLVVAFCNWLRHRGTQGNRRFDFLGLVVNKTINQTVTETFDSPDPTSVEFQKIFRELTAEALSPEKHPDRKLILVLDNLDRVDANDALKLWSAMSTFLDLPTTGSSSWSKQVWTLVPVDEAAIKRLWTEQDKNLGFSCENLPS
jgi:energy-coupling factor transporter ATP-binding protein EcfA2